MTFERCAALQALGVEHGFGRRGSDARPPPRTVQVRQVHGDALVRAPGVDPDTAADAVWTDEGGVAVAVRTADCVPIALAHRERRLVAMVHAGWRGTAARIAAQTVERLVERGLCRASELVAALGPHIGPCCYEVDAPVRAAIDSDAAFAPADRAGHYMLDLARCNREQLVGAGLGADDVHVVGGCTSCHPERYASYRRDGGGERMLHWVRMPG